jgi:hypothetical protein
MKNLGGIFEKYKNAIIFACAYTAIVSALLYFLFGFKIFSHMHWNTLFSIRLHGFAGFMLMALILTSIPFLFAATRVILKSGKPLIKLKPDPKKAEVPTEIKEEEPEPEENLPQNIPTELRGAFLRSKTGASPIHIARNDEAVVSPTTIDAPVEFAAPSLPLPDDFDFDTADAPAAPMFRDIKFDDDDDDNFRIENDKIIAVHDDSDFWIADGDEWFANGKQKPSPIKELLRLAAEKNLKPVLELRARNIMDIDDKIKEWEKLGVEVIIHNS